MPRTPEEIEKLRRVVQSALGLQLGGDASRKDEITLEEMPFNDGFVTEVTQQLDQQQKHEFWWDLGRNAGYVLLAVGILILFLRAMKQARSEALPVAAAAGPSSSNGSHENGEAPAGIVTVDVLNQLLRENPNNMTQAVRTWLNREKTPGR